MEKAPAVLGRRSGRTPGAKRGRLIARAPAVCGRGGGGTTGAKRGLRRRVTADSGSDGGNGAGGRVCGVMGAECGGRVGVGWAGSSAIHRATSRTVNDSTAPVGVVYERVGCQPGGVRGSWGSKLLVKGWR
jgi:hypothetical protein